ncbi:MAG: diaminopimelate epimerase [Bacteroidales bacterium]|nr:diaminopimelate epimerase [Bacteroidales bacterium]
MQNFFVKSHGLGNDYIVVNSTELDFELNEKNIRTICDVHYGIGSDGILALTGSGTADFGVRILNPDGSEAEKSGNGLRIFSKFLYDHRYVFTDRFSIETPGGVVYSQIMETRNGKAVTIQVDMGTATFEPSKIPVVSELPECIDDTLELPDATFTVNCVSVGNPHCVVLRDELSLKEVLQYGPQIEQNPKFPRRINVQFAKVVSRSLVEILIWERGAGYTLASGSSSSAVAAVAVRKGLTDNDLTVRMPGGDLQLQISPDMEIRMTGRAEEIITGQFSAELLEKLTKNSA